MNSFFENVCRGFIVGDLIDGQTGMTLPLNELGTYCKHNLLGICGDKMLLIGTFEFDC
jgi:hypothetical protein